MKRLYDKALVDEMAKKYGHEKAYLSDFSQALLDIIREGLIRDGVVRLHQFGTFKLKWMKSRNGVHPSTGERVMIQGRPRVIFTPAKGLKDTIEPEPPELLPIDGTVEAAINKAQAQAEKTLLISLKEEAEASADNAAVVDAPPEAKPVVSANKPTEKLEHTATMQPLSVNHTAKADSQNTESGNAIETAVVAESEAELAPTQNETVVADIRDEIEVLEQVVDILKAEPHETDNLEDSDKQFNHEELAIHDTESALKDEAATEWLDKPVLEQIQQISELQYFKSDSIKTVDLSSRNESSSDHSATLSKDTEQAKQIGINTRKESELDFDLSAESQNDSSDAESGKPWLAIAAVVLVALAAGLFFTNFNQTAPIKEADSVAYNHLYSYDVSHESTNLQAEVITEALVEPVEQIAAEVEENTDESGTITEAEQFEEQVTASQNQLTEVTEAAGISPESEQIVVSAEQYSEAERARAEESVFFQQRDHKLINGDSLWRLAKKNYVNPFYWPHIYQANHQKIDNPDKVKIGRVILLPTLFGEPDALTRKDKRNIAMGYYYNYLYHKQKGNPYAYFSLIGVDKFDSQLLIEFQQEISRSDVNNLALLTE